jgi:hypothetical protein
VINPINNPYIRDEIKIDTAFSERVAAFAGEGTLYILARKITQVDDLRVRARPLVIVADEFLGNGFLINASGENSMSPGSHGPHAGSTPPGFEGGAGENGGNGGAGDNGGTVTLMCRHSSGVRISVSGGAGARGGAGGNGGPGSPATLIPGGTHTETHFDQDGNPFEVEVQDPDIEIPGTLGGGGGIGGNGGAGGNAGTIRFISIADDNPPMLESIGGAGGTPGAGGIWGPHGAHAEVPPDLDTTPLPGAFGSTGADSIPTVATLSPEDYVAGLRPLLDAEGPSCANLWASHRKDVGQHFYRQFRQSQPLNGDLAATEFARCLELQPDPDNPDNVEALQWQRQLMDFPRPTTAGPNVVWVPGGLNALGLPRNLDVLPRFKKYADAFTGFGALVLTFLQQGQHAIMQAPNLNAWQDFLTGQRNQALAAQATMVEDRDQAATDARLAREAIASVQAQLDQTTQGIKDAIVKMGEEEEEKLSIGGVIGTVAGLAGAVVAVIAAVPSLGTSLVALVPSMVALSSTVVDNMEPIAQKLMAGEQPNTEAIKKAYDKVDKQAATVVKGAKAIVDFVKVVDQLSKVKVTSPNNSERLALVRQGVAQTYELLLARHRVTSAEQRFHATEARVKRAADNVVQIDALKNNLQQTEEKLRATGLHAIAIAESKADALLTLAFYAQRSVEIYTLTDQEDKVRLESGHLHPDDRLKYRQGEIKEIELSNKLLDSWESMLQLLDLEVAFNKFTTQFHEPDARRLSFPAGSPEVAALRAHHRFSFRVDPTTLPPGQVDAKVRGVRLALVGATNPTTEVTCTIGHGSSYETRRKDGSVTATVLQARVSHRFTKVGSPLLADEGTGSDLPLTDPQSIAFWGRGVGGEWEFSIPEHTFAEGLDLTGLTEVQVWIIYQFLS